MNPGPPEMYYQQPMSAGQQHPPPTATSGALTHYAGPQGQPPLLHPGQGHSQPHTPYAQYGYTNGLTSPSAAMPMSSSMPGGHSVLPHPLPGPTPQQPVGQPVGSYSFDSTGQNPPPGMKPRVTATLWEDEGSLCFQVEARGICVARREDNHMINGTKLLNVAGMTRGRRDGILKSEKVRHVVKIGPMHLKGVWIPYERALDFANKEKITELLYPLFVHNIGALLYHPTNQNRTSQVMAAAERRKQEQGHVRSGSHPGLPSIGQTQAHSMPLPGHQQPSLPSNNPLGRPQLDRAHTFPTPPTSASSVINGMGSSEGFGGWQGQGMNGHQGNNPMGIDATGLSNARSMPTTPATTPPGSMQPYQSAQHGYDNTRQMYNAQQTHQHSYPPSAGAQERMYGQGGSYVKNDMGPPTSRPATSAPPAEQHDTKPPNGIMTSEQGAQPQSGEEDGEQETEYTHDNSGAYDATRPAYNYTAPSVGALTGEANMPTDVTGSPNHGPASGRATPRTTAPHPNYYQHPAGYGTPPRIPQQPTSNLYNVMSNDRASTNGAHGNEVYGSSGDMSNPMTNGYAPQPPGMNGLKRSRDDDELPRPITDGMDLKRRKTIESSVSAPSYDINRATAPMIPGGHRQ